MTTDPVPPSMFAGYHYTVNPKKPGYDGLWGTHPEFGLMRGTENIIGTSATRRGKALRSGAYAIFRKAVSPTRRGGPDVFQRPKIDKETTHNMIRVPATK